LIERAKKTEAYKLRLAAEEKGVEDLNSGNYELGKDPLKKITAS